MANGETKHGDASADKWRERFEKLRREDDRGNDRLEVRAEMKSMGEDEVSAVIDQRALEKQQQREKSDPPPSKSSPLIVVLTVAKKFPPWGAVIVALAALATWAYVKTH